MPIKELSWNLVLMFLCYAYVAMVILVSGLLEKVAHVSRKTRRKFLHIMIGNLPFMIPCFTVKFLLGLVAALASVF